MTDLVLFWLENSGRQVHFLLSHIHRLSIRLMSLLGDRDMFNDCIIAA